MAGHGVGCWPAMAGGGRFVAAEGRLRRLSGRVAVLCRRVRRRCLPLGTVRPLRQNAVGSGWQRLAAVGSGWCLVALDTMAANVGGPIRPQMRPLLLFCPTAKKCPAEPL